jgi:hypothetical protein
MNTLPTDYKSILSFIFFFLYRILETLFSSFFQKRNSDFTNFFRIFSLFFEEIRFQFARSQNLSGEKPERIYDIRTYTFQVLGTKYKFIKFRKRNVLLANGNNRRNINKK